MTQDEIDKFAEKIVDVMIDYHEKYTMEFSKSLDAFYLYNTESCRGLIVGKSGDKTVTIKNILLAVNKLESGE